MPVDTMQRPMYLLYVGKVPSFLVLNVMTSNMPGLKPVQMPLSAGYSSSCMGVLLTVSVTLRSVKHARCPAGLMNTCKPKSFMLIFASRQCLH